MAEYDGQERTEKPTPKRLQEAREKGQVPRSRELGTALALLAGAGAYIVLGGRTMSELREMVTEGLTVSHAEAFDQTALWIQLSQGLYQGVILSAPLFVLMMAAVMLTYFVPDVVLWLPRQMQA